MLKVKLPNPGSDEAEELGCTCPRMDNRYGAGYLGDSEKFGFVWNMDCPLHGKLRQQEIEIMQLHVDVFTKNRQPEEKGDE
jgi:hypothetical protein